MTTGSFPSITETHEFVVPKSIPIIFPILLYVFSVKPRSLVNDCATGNRRSFSAKSVKVLNDTRCKCVELAVFVTEILRCEDEGQETKDKGQETKDKRQETKEND